LWFLYIIRDVIVLLFVAIILVSAMEPLVDYFQKKKISPHVDRFHNLYTAFSHYWRGRFFSDPPTY